MTPENNICPWLDEPCEFWNWDKQGDECFVPDKSECPIEKKVKWNHRIKIAAGRE